MPNTKLFLYFNESINPKRGIPVIYAFVPSMDQLSKYMENPCLSKPPSSPNMLCEGNFFINFLTFFSIRRSTFVTNSFLILFFFSALEIFLI